MLVVAVAPDKGSETEIVITPVAIPVTKPVESTVATPRFEVVHCKLVGRLIGLPNRSVAVAVNRVVAPGATDGFVELSARFILFTIIVADLVDSDTGSVTVIVAVPTAIPVTKPVESTAATPRFEDDHCKLAGRLIGLPNWSVAVAVNKVDAPGATDGFVGLSARFTLLTVTVDDAVTSDTVSVRVMVAVPPATPVTKPVESTVAMALFEDVH
jgi:hypothetical protein